MRMGGTVRTAGALYNALYAVASGEAPGPGSPLDPALLAGRSAREILDALVEAVRPIDGTLDAEASRWSINQAYSELLERYGEADLLNLSDAQRFFLIERFVAQDVWARIDLDVGQTIQDKAATHTGGLARLKEIKELVVELVSAEFRKLWKKEKLVGARRIAEMAERAIQKTLYIFEEYLT